MAVTRYTADTGATNVPDFQSGRSLKMALLPPCAAFNEIGMR